MLRPPTQAKERQRSAHTGWTCDQEWPLRVNRDSRIDPREGRTRPHRSRKSQLIPRDTARVAEDGASVAMIAKTAEPHPKLPGTVFTAAREIEEAGGHALRIS
jgi:hypothetical protein